MRYGYIIALGIVSALVSGCSVHPADPKINMKPPKYVEQMPSLEKPENRVGPGSLFGKGDNPLFSDKKAMNVNDIITVVIDENAFQSSSGNKKITKDSSTKLGGGYFTPGDGGVGQTLSGATNPLTNVNFQAGSNSNFKAQASKDRKEKFSTTISARVVKILYNGNYFIEGNRELLINGEKQIIQLTGIIRPYDIDQTNTINSKYIADAKISYKTEGSIDQANKKGWGARMLETIWPF